MFEFGDEVVSDDGVIYFGCVFTCNFFDDDMFIVGYSYFDSVCFTVDANQTVTFGIGMPFFDGVVGGFESLFYLLCLFEEFVLGLCHLRGERGVLFIMVVMGYGDLRQVL